MSHSKILSIQLNSFVRRVDDKQQVLALVTQQQCTLKRIRRSKNWLLSGSETQLTSLMLLLTDLQLLWINQAIVKGLPKPKVNLQQLISSYPDMTLNKLIAQTGCSLSEARIAFDLAEDFSD
ncbi:ribosome recycling factor family protein [Psychromonas sp. GE-S-Ul-11]|uniref:ribosome recycling factor family protein n=1 Tax=Psychromonas sp. GE-S-Ul-11 TaxID=3241170 RepID=UPI00390C7719